MTDNAHISDDTELVLHIGAAKTGSSAIQRFLAGNIDWLAENGFVVPDRNLELSSKRTGEHVFALEALFKAQVVADVTRSIDALFPTLAPGQRLLLSGENMSNLGRHSFFEEIAAQRRTQVILYIRRQDDLLTSAWQQWHSKVEEDFNAWLVLAVRQYGQWERIIKDWEGIVGQGNVKVAVFDRDDFPDGDILKDFTGRLGIENTEAANFDIGTVNPSYADFITPLVAGNRNIFDDPNDSGFYQLVGRLTGAKYQGGPKYSLLTPRQREKLVEFYNSMNRRVCQEYFPDRPRLFKRVNHAKYTYLTPDDMADRQMRFMMEMIYRIANEDRS